MPRRRMKTRVIREILRLKSMGRSVREVCQSVNVSAGSVSAVLRKAGEAGLKWPLPWDVDDRKLEEILYPKSEGVREGKTLPDFSYVHKELKRKGVTRQLLWREYAEENPENHYSYSRFCELYDIWLKKNKKPSMRQVHKAGEKCFVDYAGMTVDITDPITGEAAGAQIFVGVMGASNYIFAEAAASQSLEHWLGSHTRMLEFFCGVPEIIVPDNLRSGVTKACRYDPDINPAYLQWANHYGTVIIPARPYKPKDKAKAENAVQIVERSVLAPIRNEVFFSLAELNGRVGKLVASANSMSFQKLEGSRAEQFGKVDLPALGPLPPYPYTYTDIKRAKVNIDYHVEYRKKLYSVPCAYRGERVEVHATENIIMVYFKNKLIAQHKRLGRDVTLRSPLTCPRVTGSMRSGIRGGSGTGPGDWETRCSNGWFQLESRDHPEQAYRACLGLMSLSRDYPQRVNEACGVANRNGLVRLNQIKEILKNGMDRVAPPEEQSASLPQDHENIGPGTI